MHPAGSELRGTTHWMTSNSVRSEHGEEMMHFSACAARMHSYATLDSLWNIESTYGISRTTNGLLALS